MDYHRFLDHALPSIQHSWVASPCLSIIHFDSFYAILSEKRVNLIFYAGVHRREKYHLYLRVWIDR